MTLTIEKTASGHSAITLANQVFAILPRGDGFALFTGPKGGPIETMDEGRLNYAGERFSAENEFVTYMDELAGHRAQVKELGREDEPSSARTPWGKADNATVYDKGVVFYSTSGHGGFKVGKKLNAVIPEAYRNENGWYEEDCEWAKVAVGLPHLFTDREKRQALSTLIGWFPDAYEQVTGKVIPEGQSFKKDERLFRERHANDWIVISAQSSKEHQGMVECFATVAGERSRWENGRDITVDERRFLVPSGEYSRRSRYGFVVDLDRHEEIGLAPAQPGM